MALQDLEQWFLPRLCIVAWTAAVISSSLCPHQNFDVLVYRATPAGIASAIAVREMGKTVVLLEPTFRVGGMATEGGVGLRDGPDDMRLDPRNSQYQWGLQNAQHYGLQTKSPIWQPDHSVGEASFLSMLDKAGVKVCFNTNIVEGPAGLQIEDGPPRRILSVQLEDTTWIQAMYVIDASYEGEIMMAANVSFAVGRESVDTYQESRAGVTNHSEAQFTVPIHPWASDGSLLPYIQPGWDPRTRVGMADDNLMAYSYRVCLTTNRSNAVPVTPPPGYNPADFELARRYLLAELEANLTVSDPWLYLAYRGYDLIPDHRTMKMDACCGLGAVGIDAVGLAVGYPTASRRERSDIAKRHRYYVQGLLWFWRSDPAVPSQMRSEHANYGLCRDEWPDNGHFPRQLYVREAARMIGDQVFSQHQRTRDCRTDSVGVGTWGFDIHEMQRVPVDSENGWIVFNEGLTYSNNGGTVPFDLPYFLILPKRTELTNLAVPSCPSVSHVAFAAVREEPTLWQLGTAAGTAAAMAAMNHSGPMALHDVNIRRLQQALRQQGAMIHWPFNRTRFNVSFLQEHEEADAMEERL